MAARGVGIVILIVGITFLVLKVVGYAGGAFVAIGMSLVAIGAAVLGRHRRHKPSPPESP